jgi:hypothetical protein
VRRHGSGFHAASIFPVSRTFLRCTIRKSVILSGGAELDCGISITGGTDSKNLVAA